MGGLFIALIALVAFVVGPLRRTGEFAYAEGCKGYWRSLQDFVKQNGRYPRDEVEINAFFNTATDKEPVEYVAPHDDEADEVVLWWKEKSMFGARIGITESGTIIKKGSVKKSV